MRFQDILFDLDGTLTASGPGITRSAQYALHRMGIEEPDAKKLTFFVGPPLNLTFRERYGMNEAQTAQAIGYFREQYDSKGVFENELYPGVPEMLKKLSLGGCRLAIASSKPENLVHKVLERFGIASYFTVIVGSAPDAELDNKAGADNKQQMVKKALQELSLPESAGGRMKDCAMVGDRFYDIEGAIANDVTAVGVSYGYGSRIELEKAGAAYVADSVEELQAFLQGGGHAERK